MPGCLQPGAQYTHKAGLYSPSEQQQQQQQQPVSKQVDDLGLDLSKQGKRWFPFSDGPRNCVGQALAKMNMAATFAQLYSHYSFQLAEEVTTIPTTLGQDAPWLVRCGFGCAPGMQISMCRELVCFKGAVCMFPTWWVHTINPKA